jgi:GNAT superfamily N-acetyltransferase
MPLIEGVRSFAVKATCCSRLVLLERRLDEAPPSFPARPDLELGLLSADDVSEYVELVPAASARAVLARLRRGDVCFCARHQGRLIALGWAVLGKPRIPWVPSRPWLTSGHALIDGVFVADDQRGQNVWPVLGACAQRWLRDRGYRRTLLAVPPGNRASLRSAAKLGYRRSGVAYLVGLGAVRGLILAPAKPPGGRPGNSLPA